MTFNKAIDLSATDAGEEAFGIDEVFFSRTDKRGIIRAGNEVFRRTSGFGWDQLIGAPHRLVRNHDTPKAVFWLLWQTIQAGRPMVAYVKNKSQRGGWYWVLAVIVPTEDGYLSVRIKPSGASFSIVKTIYAEIAALEKAQSLSPDRSCELLFARLAEAGFPTYCQFMHAVLEQEFAVRDSALGRSNMVQVRALATIKQCLRSTLEQQAALMQDFDALQSIPTNMRIIASRLEPSGGPISAISDNYKFASTEITRRLEAFAGADQNLCLTMSDSVGLAFFLAGTSRLLSEVPRQFATEDHSTTPIDVKTEKVYLAEIDKEFVERARVAMLNAEHVSTELNQSSSEIRRMMLGLDTIRVMGRVESGRLGADGVGLSSTIDQLDLRHADIAQRLQVLMDLSATIKVAINAYQRQAQTRMID
ncbi:PAS domain-containing protein [Rhodobacter ferrooxidans]|uniref:PAS/PAC sensor protein n=1 Tax=Rhodobacter ferrooxidans TaxID=371731 RepID=C8S4C8_9RHOB|nr:PAS domain-containing protein [Rhodobacter sp. SW2]EEW24187.1 conserved hypothetical protein [Rhodobacter sp. SW2]